MRHGQSELNVKELRAGVTDTPLTDKGRLQAKKAGMEAHIHNIDTIVCSPLSRAHETAKLVARELAFDAEMIHVNSLLIERNFGSLEMQPYDPDLDLDGFSDVESWDEMTTRAQLALKWIESLDGENILVVSHGSLGRAMRSLLVPEHDIKDRLANAQLVQWL
jgi:probable phosphoglycerate mutase